MLGMHETPPNMQACMRHLQTRAGMHETPYARHAWDTFKHAGMHETPYARHAWDTFKHAGMHETPSNTCLCM